MFALLILGTVIVLFSLTYLTMRRGKGKLYEIITHQRHPYRSTLWLAVGSVAGMVIAYLIQRYLKPSPLESLGYIVFFQFLLTGFIAIVFGVRFWNLEKKLSKDRKG